MRRVVPLLIAIVASCGHDDGGANDGGSVDARVDAFYAGICTPGSVTMSCIGGVAKVTKSWHFPASSGSACRLPPPDARTTTCAGGCAIEGEVHFSQDVLGPPSTVFGVHVWNAPPDVLCAGAPMAISGAACSENNICIPTTAELAGDGTVSGQMYLACNQQSNTCTATTPPVIRNYLARCNDALITQYGGTNVTGAVGVTDFLDGVCLLAWDTAAQAMTSGLSIRCIGDWMCPEGARCDDQILDLAAGGGATVAVCKPGPRGVINPADLAP